MASTCAVTRASGPTSWWQRADLDLGLVACVLSSAAFGSSGPFAKALLATGWTASSLVTWRVGIAGLVLLGPALLAARGRWEVVWRQRWVILGVGLTGVAGCQVAYFNAVQRMPIGVALLLEYLGVVLVVLWIWLRTGRPPHRATVGGIVVSLGGLALVLDVTGAASTDVIGVVWGLAAAVGLAAYFVLVADSDRALPPVVLACFGMLVGAVALGALGASRILPSGVARDDLVLSGMALPWWLGVLELAVVAAAAAYLLGAIGARRLGSTVASFVGLTEVLFAVFLAWLLLGELPRPVQFAGGALVLAGVIAVRWSESRVRR